VHESFPAEHALHSLTKTINIAEKKFEDFIHHPSQKNFFIDTIENEKDTALYLHTSGTTSRPKIVELSYSNLDCFPKALQTIMDDKIETVAGIVLPMSHISGPIMLNFTIATQCKLSIISQVNPESLFENIAKHKITFFHAVPPIFNLMLKYNLSEKYNISSLDVIAMMGTSVPASVMQAFKKTFPFVTVLQGYGLTETSPLITLTKRKDAIKKMNSMGCPVQDAEVKVVNEKDEPVGENEIGELIVKGPMVMKGYLNAPEENKKRFKNGFFYTNDLVKYDAENYFYHMGRRDDMVVLHNGKKCISCRNSKRAAYSPQRIRSSNHRHLFRKKKKEAFFALS